jgi:hypothetical protein
MTPLRFLAAGGLLVAMVGCSSGGPQFVPVSGVITLDGKPYGNAVISFQPIGTGGNPYPGRGSSAFTDENGRFVLMCDGKINGAVVGKHHVRITSRGSSPAITIPDGGTPDDTPVRREVDPVPPEWNLHSKVEFDVPPGGTDQANFDIQSRRRK